MINQSNQSIRRIINSRIRWTLLFILFYSVSYSQTSGSDDSYCNKGELVIIADNQEQLEFGLNLCVNPISVHLKLSPRIAFNLERLKKINSVKRLSIEFPGMEMDQGVFDYSMNSMDVLNCSFLAHFTQLEFLVIDWKGMLIHTEEILDLPNLIFARIPISAFSPVLFRDKSAIIQFEFGDRLEFVVSRDENPKRLCSSLKDYENFLALNNRKLKAFTRKAKRMNEMETINWPNEFNIVNEFKDSLLFMTDRREDDVSWNISISPGINFKGNYNSMSNMTARNLTAYSREMTMVLHGGSQYTLTRKIKSSDDNSNARIKETGFIDGVPHGVFSESSRGEKNYKRVYENGQLVYKYGYKDSLPSIGKGTPVWFQLEHLYAPYKEFFYKNGEPTLIRAYSGKIEDSNTVQHLEVPFIEGKAHGTLSIFNNAGDTIIADFVDGLLDGNYHYYRSLYGDTLRYDQRYSKGKLNGNSIKISNKTTTKITYTNSRIDYLLMYSNETNVKIVEVIWYPEKDYSETKNWNLDGVLLRIHRNGEKGKLIFNKEYVKTDVNLPPPPP